MTRPRVKICCISSITEAKLAVAYGASALGLVGHMPSGPGVIDDELIADIARKVPPPVASFLLTSQQQVPGIVAHYQRVHTTTIQIVDELENRDYEALRKALPHVKLVQVIHVQNERSVAEAIAISQQVDALLLDSGSPDKAVKELGGTGRVHDWSLSRQIVQQAATPVFLAGGLRPDNVKAAIEAVQPFGLDLCSGVRTNGQLDEAKLAAFFQAIG
ncbi:MAG: phosphoribosylanthranilate isomerase [Chitinophagaceae bacterium]|jgi:phosphoribosylanthranilate isomerase|nr:phosphoribosylanthranilate isomerase [Chitinophagaceae bacterium]